MVTITLRPDYLSMTPGQILQENLSNKDTSIGSISEITTIAKASIYGVLSDERAITPYIALKLSKVFDIRPEEWLAYQSRYDLCREKYIEEEGLERDVGKTQFHTHRKKLIRIQATSDRQGILL